MRGYVPTSDQLCQAFCSWSYDPHLKKVWDRIANRLRSKRIPITMFTLLGSGTQGKAFQINDNTVIKISDDEDEPMISMIIKQNPSAYFVRIKDVFTINVHLGEQFHCIVQEKLDKPEEKWANFASDFGGCVVKPYMVQRFKDRRSDNNGKVPRGTSNKFKWLNGVADYFQKHNISYKDLHEGNLMRKGDKHKLIDLGYARIPQKKRSNIKVDVL